MEERRISIDRETTLYNNLNQIIIRTTADFLDYLQTAPWLTDQKAARDYLGKETIPFIRAVREGGFRFMTNSITSDRLNDAVNQISRTHYRPLRPAIGEFVYHSKPIESFEFAMVMLSHMSKPQLKGNPHYFQSPGSPAEFFAFTHELEHETLSIALGTYDPRQISDTPKFKTLTRFFRIGRDLRIKIPESMNNHSLICNDSLSVDPVPPMIPIQ